MLPTIDEMCRGTLGLDGNPLNHRRIRAVLEDNKRQRSANRFLSNGWTRRREGIGRAISNIPIDICLNPYSPYYVWFDPQMDAHEIKKAFKDFHKKTGNAFLVVDRA